MERICSMNNLSKRKTLKVFETFAGYGSQRMALRNLAQIGGNLNYESVGILEIDLMQY